MTRRRGSLGAAVGAGVPVLLLAACSFSSATSGARSGSGRSGVSSGGVGTSVVSSASAGSVSGGGVSMVTCTGSTCSVTLGGQGSRAQALGTTFSIVRIDGVRATVRAGDREVSCSPGRTVAAGPVTVHCGDVSGNTVRFTVTRG